MDHIVAEQDKKKGTTKTVADAFTVQMALRSFTTPGTCKLVETQYAIHWVHTNEDGQNEDEPQALQSEITIDFQFTDPLIVPFHKV